MLLSCRAEEEMELPVVDGRGTWMLTREHKIDGDAVRVVATKLGSDVSVELPGFSSPVCRGSAADLVRLPGDTASGAAPAPQILRLTQNGFELEPDVVPEGVVLSGCPLVWTEDRAVLEACDGPCLSFGELAERLLYVVATTKEGLTTTTAIDAGTGAFSGRAQAVPDQTQLVYRTEPDPSALLYHVDLTAKPPTPTLIDEVPDDASWTLSQDWVVYASDTTPGPLRAHRLDAETGTTVALATPGKSWVDLGNSKWFDEELVVIPTLGPEDAGLLFLVALSGEEPKVTVLDLGELRPISSGNLSRSLDFVVSGFQRGVAETRSKGIARIDPRDPGSPPEVIFDIPGNNPYAALNWLGLNEQANRLFLEWTDDVGRRRLIELDVASGEQLEITDAVGDCDWSEFRPVNEELTHYTGLCTTSGRERAFLVDREDFGRKIWLDDFDRRDDEIVSEIVSTTNRGIPGWVAVATGPRSSDPDMTSTHSIGFFSPSGELRTSRSPKGWTAGLPWFMTLE